MSPGMAKQIADSETRRPISTAWDHHRWLDLLLAADMPASTADPMVHATDAASITAAEAIFAAVYRILLEMARHQRATLLDLVPLFSAQIHGLMHCLRAPRANATPEQMEQFHASLPFPLVSRHAPLPTACAHWMARLLSALVDRGAIQAGTRDANAAASTSQYQRALGKHAPYLLADWLAIELDPHSQLTGPVRAALQPGVFALLDLCTEHERHYLQVSMDQAGRARFKDIYRDYMAHHKYTGKA
ncbi:Urb2/Npa2 family-domain-containing protein [Syncephalis pseudoplumigaleata]|uniref:Urb2/Npa2 family-domain-containing protein n=1 Tax=Syncephalis pseudoplumigaleata TaxID=1712513 RepID=A0A4P9Z4X9_9FUNG|nr:Urb2/Npa2 family-domain-containing protein [Syncephalis pseudoplumigaleata]|eukprot:RKP27643.1 Urb2/Npa2 family-domain-containing protein [Syncephalis pseudoplumigaleata]